MLEREKKMKQKRKEKEGEGEWEILMSPTVVLSPSQQEEILGGDWGDGTICM